MRVSSIPYGTIAKASPVYDGADRDVLVYEWRATKNFWGFKGWGLKVCALLFTAGAFVALLTRGRYHVRIRFYDWESSVG